MARIRTLKPEFWVSEQIGNCSRDARLLFIGLWNFCDDRGVHPAKPRTLKAEVFPQDDDINLAMVSAWVAELLQAGLIAEFSAEGQAYWYVTGWSRHQRIDKPTNKHPAPPGGQGSRSSPGAVDETSPSVRGAFAPGVEGIGAEGNGRGAEKEEGSASRAPMSAAHLVAAGLTPESAAGLLEHRHHKGLRVLMRGAWQAFTVEAAATGRTVQQVVDHLIEAGSHLEGFRAEHLAQHSAVSPVRRQPLLVEADQLAATGQPFDEVF